ncbi:MAG TPA: thiolase domain-containing protein [Methanomassiliicoccaceae archaeon]|jgi:acetyl-CoA C-acetyltransferase|nr:thiolase domain-containing protein [Euryarchaeota archaeon]HOB37827.1 thiolase domain-containing protein [Methanomassiliicoccaceae archaeon]HOQ25197.1 thiolase domain-containing protein [Methanomassiliicoccaceae archaeon]HQA20295.1 thiolase domain-containing protein [Methanomassiliicoccaceae archaeon]HQD87324.1 thiolase domain-containing protein [Methanomassiliicoccaceae archaeon]
MREVAIIGVGDTKFGELWDMSLRDLGIQAGLSAVYDANLSGDEIDALYLGNMSAGKFTEQEHIGALISDYSGLARDHIPATRVEAAGASGGLAFRQGVMAVASGMHDIVVVGGAEKMTDVGDTLSTEIQAMAADQQWETSFGATFPALHAMIARRHMHEYGTTREQIASVAVKNHKHGSLNPKAQFQKEIKLESVLRSLPVAEPLGMFDCAPVSDGGAAVVLCPLEKARKYTDTPVKVLASAQASDTLSLANRESLCRFDATTVAAQRAFKMAGLEPKDVQLAEVHDSYTISEILAIEDLGFFPKGKGGQATADGETTLGSKLAVNTSGGLKARGDPIGATGVAQVVELVRQLRGEADKRQVSGAEVGLAQNVGGTGATVVVQILGRVN